MQPFKRKKSSKRAREPSRQETPDKKRARLYKIFLAMAAVVVFGTTYALILPAITQETPVYCNYESAHTDACYKEVQTLICGHSEGEEGHVHTDDCYITEKVLVCGKEAHDHTLQCFSNPDADVEDDSTWERMAEEAGLTGDWGADVAALAQKQLGYTESPNNYAVAEGDVKKGYTRFGGWYGDRYMDWNAVFCAFCLEYAGVSPDLLPRDVVCDKWVDKLAAADLYHEAAGYVPQLNDLIFFAGDAPAEEDAAPSTRLDPRPAGRMGIVVGLVTTDDGQLAEIKTIEGDCPAEGREGDCVDYMTYAVDDSRILGFASIPQNPDPSQIGKPVTGEPVSVEPEADSAELEALDAAPAQAPMSLMATGDDSTPPEPFVNTSPASSYLTSSGANDWQIVDKKYDGNAQSNKTGYDGTDAGTANDIYYQKNVIPTSVEDEFLVYLSIDRQATLKDLFDDSMFTLTTSKGYVTGVANKIKGNWSPIDAHGDDNGGGHAYRIILDVYQTQADYTAGRSPLYHYDDIRHGSTPNCANGSLLMVFNATALGGNMEQGDPCLPIDVGVDLFDEDIPSYSGTGHGHLMHGYVFLDLVHINLPNYDTLFDSVVDKMGSQVELQEVVYCDGSVSSAGDVLTWYPVANPDVKATIIETNNVLDGWVYNTCQLVYKVRLKTEKTGFNSCADNMNSSIDDPDSYKVNESANLTYHTQTFPEPEVPADRQETGATQRTEFPIPYVRGLNYNIDGTKTGEGAVDVQSLPGATFALYQADGVTPVLDESGEPWVVTTGEDGKLGYHHIPWGTYVLKELEAPFGYELMPDNPWTITLCYTTTPGLLEQDPNYRDDMRINHDASRHSVIQVEDPVVTKYNLVQLVKVDGDTGATVSGAVFAMYGDGKSEPLGGCENLVSGNDGVFSLDSMRFPYGTYQLREISAAEGYRALEGDLTIVSAASGITISNPDTWPKDATLTKVGSTYVITVPNRALSQDLTITKTVTGVDPIPDTAFPFTLTLSEGQFPAPAEDAGYTVSADGTEATFTLAHNGSITVKVPGNAVVTLTETEHSGYAPIIKDVTPNESGVAADTTLANGDTATVTVSKPTTLSVINTTGYEMPHTGGVGTVLFTAGGVILMAAALSLTVLRRGKEL